MPKATLDLGPLKPLRQADSERSADGRVTVSESRQPLGWFGQVLSKGLDPGINLVALDETGSLIWDLCDGEHDVHTIAATLAERFGEDFDPTHQRLAIFLQTMLARGWIIWREEEI